MLVYPNLLIFFKFGKYDVKRKKNEEKLLDFLNLKLFVVNLANE